jgi:predicted acylesterase/phospholipase RssA
LKYSFVCATRAELGSYTALLRSYTSQNEEIDCKIWEAARATSAASTFFDPITIGKYQETFVDGGVYCNNPVEVVFSEAHKIWCDVDSRLQCIISLGTGKPAEKDFGSNLLEIGRSLISIATETENTHIRFQETFMNRQKANSDISGAIYLWFNVSSGLEGVGLDEYDQSSKIASATRAYLIGQRLQKDLKVFVTLLGSDNTTGVKRYLKNW